MTIKIRKFARKLISFGVAALGYEIYSRPSKDWPDLREYCTIVNRHDLDKVHARGIKFHMYTRRGTGGIHNYRRIIDHKENDFLPIMPLTIIDLGAASVWR